MKISDRALNFAIKAHESEYKRERKNCPFVLHQMIVGDILKYYNFDDNVVAAGYLHDIVENTNYTIEDIGLLFGGDIASLVMTSTNPVICDDFTDNKKNKIKTCRNLPIRNKAVILADEIANIEELRIKEEHNILKSPEDLKNKKTYTEEIYESLAIDADNTELVPLLYRLYNNIYLTFYNFEEGQRS